MRTTREKTPVLYGPVKLVWWMQNRTSIRQRPGNSCLQLFTRMGLKAYEQLLSENSGFVSSMPISKTDDAETLLMAAQGAGIRLSP